MQEFYKHLLMSCCIIFSLTSSASDCHRNAARKQKASFDGEIMCRRLVPFWKEIVKVDNEAFRVWQEWQKIKLECSSGQRTAVCKQARKTHTELTQAASALRELAGTYLDLVHQKSFLEAAEKRLDFDVLARGTLYRVPSFVSHNA